jgi:sphingolipid delta-4 desaturase
MATTETTIEKSFNEPTQIKQRNKHEFLFTYQEEPHRTRRMQIIKAHPEVTKLVGHEPLTKYIVIGVVSLQLSMAVLLRNASFSSWYFWVAAYLIGATCDSNVFLAIHELSHNLGFKKPIHNKLFAIFTNLPIGIPYSAGFGPYHQLHHKHMGEPEYDTDLPTPLEAMFLSSIGGKAFFATFQLFFYALRPMFIVNLKFTYVHFLNILVQVVVDYLLIKTAGWMAFYYLLVSAFLAGSLHPIAGHFIAEHYVLGPPKTYDLRSTMLPETYSYYGPLNFFVYNAGYHNEHHDFPYIPWTRIKKLREIATEFYDPLPYYTSWVRVIWDFVFDDNVSLWCRVQRPDRAYRTGDDEQDKTK